VVPSTAKAASDGSLFFFITRHTSHVTRYSSNTIRNTLQMTIQ